MSKFASMPAMKGDASKVTVDGNGLKKGYRNKQCSFNVDTSKAGKWINARNSFDIRLKEAMY